MFFSDEVKISELIISNKIENMKAHWFQTNEQYNFKDAIELSTFTTYRSTFRLEKFLKRLHYKGYFSDYDLLNLSDLTQLEQLKFDLDHPNESTFKAWHINLPNLKILEIGNLDRETEEYHFYLNTPKLEMLKCDEFDLIHVAHPNTITHLELTFYNATIHSLKNLQYLKVDWGFRYLMNQNILSTHPKLKTLLCNHFDYDGESDFDESMIALHDIVAQKLILKRPEFKIYYQSVELGDRDKIEEYVTTPTILEFQINNYSSLCDSISYNDPVEYNPLMRLLKDKLPDDFFKTYFNIQWVKISDKVKSQEHLIRFLKSLDYLNKLDLKNTFLDQTFYDSLHNFGQLSELRIVEMSTPIVNYDFLFKLNLLETFTTDRDFPDFFDLSLRLYRVLKYFKSITFYSDKECISISKDWHSEVYTFSRCKDSSRKKKLFEKDRLDFDHLVDFVNAHKNIRSN